MSLQRHFGGVSDPALHHDLQSVPLPGRGSAVTLGKIMKTWIVFLALFAVARGEPVFLGMLGTAKDGTFFVISFSEDVRPKWLTIGDTYEGYRVVAYKPRDEQLLLRKEGKEVVLHLRNPKVRSEPTPQAEVEVRDLAKSIVAKWDGWNLAETEIMIWYKSDWNIAATRVIDGNKETRIISAPDGFRISAGP